MSDKEGELKKLQPHEMHNSELVSKLMAATPSYFFTPPQAGHNFFFSELLRSLVQKRKAEELTSAMKSKAMPKKARKPTFQYQKPLESEWKRQKMTESQSKLPCDANENDDPKTNSPNNEQNENSQDSVINVDKDDSPPAPALPSSQINSSAFYPYVDPLHFFIDLRVSAGHDRKKEVYLQQALKNNILLDSNTWNNPIIGRNRAGSAFKVPGSMSEPNNNFSAMNLVNHDQSSKYYQKHQPESVSPREKPEEEVEVFDIDDKSDNTKRSN